jgi:uncharacterized lipoprotein YehR (DUF1307 family)
MSETKPRKRAHSLANENVKRIADVLRTERNDALALAQLKRQEADSMRKQLIEAQSVMKGLIASLEGEDLKAAEKCLADMTQALSEDA